MNKYHFDFFVVVVRIIGNTGEKERKLKNSKKKTQKYKNGITKEIFYLIYREKTLVYWCIKIYAIELS